VTASHSSLSPLSALQAFLNHRFPAPPTRSLPAADATGAGRSDTAERSLAMGVDDDFALSFPVYSVALVQASSGSSSDALTPAATVGIVVAVVLSFVAMLLLLYCCCVKGLTWDGSHFVFDGDRQTESFKDFENL
jgi:hypothetical protein